MQLAIQLDRALQFSSLQSPLLSFGTCSESLPIWAGWWNKEMSAVSLSLITVNSLGEHGGSLISLTGSPMDSVLFPTAASAPAAQSTTPSSAWLSSVMAEKQVLSVPSFLLFLSKHYVIMFSEFQFQKRKKKREAHVYFCLSSPSCCANASYNP